MIVVRLAGGLGNQMFQYCYGLNLAKKYNTKFYLDTSYLLDRKPKENFVFRNFDLEIFKLDDKYYGGTINHPIPKFLKYINLFLPLSFKNFYKEASFEFDKNSNKTPAKKIYFEGYWQSPKYFNESINDVISSFEFNVDFSEKVLDKIIEIENSNSVCINVRRGDFVDNSFHGTMGTDYYQKALDLLLKETGKELKLFIFSDDMEWCKSNLQFGQETYFVEHDYKGEKFSSYLYLMQTCKYFIIPNSSFAWWAAFLAKYPKKIIYVPKNWFNSTLNTSDLIPSNWIRI
jgi:hypothetical protein